MLLQAFSLRMNDKVSLAQIVNDLLKEGKEAIRSTRMMDKEKFLILRPYLKMVTITKQLISELHM